MSKKVLILSGSPRKGGNSDLLCDEFMRGAMEAGHEVDKIRVQEKYHRKERETYIENLYQYIQLPNGRYHNSK